MGIRIFDNQTACGLVMIFMVKHPKEKALVRAFSRHLKLREGSLTTLLQDRDGVHPEGGAIRQDADEDGGPPLPPPICPPDILQVLY